MEENVNMLDLGFDEEDALFDDAERILAECDVLMAEDNAGGFPEDDIVEPERWWSSREITVGELVNMMQSGCLNAEMVYQRKAGVGAWKKREHVDKLVDSIMRGWFIQPFLWRVSENTGQHDIVDSLQRTNAIMQVFLGYHIPNSLEGDFEHLNGKTFMMWSKDDRDQFLSQKVLIIDICDDDEENIVEYFIRINKGGVPLTTAQAKRGKYTDKIKALSEPIAHSVFNLAGQRKDGTYMLSEGGREEVIIKACNTIYADMPNHDSKSVVDWFINWNMPSTVVLDINSRVGRLSSALTVVKSMEKGDTIVRRIVKKTHLSVLIAVLDESVSAYAAGESLHEFFSRDPKENATARMYKELCQSGTGKTDSIRKRTEILRDVVKS